MPDFSNFIEPEATSFIQSYLDENPDGVSEHELLNYLDKHDFFDALNSEVSATLLLFQKHFLLFHILYSINQQWVAEKQGSLSISPLLIQKLVYVEAKSQIGSVNTLSEYYLDLSNLNNTNEDNVNDLLDQFWEKFLRNEKRGDALKALGLEEPVTDKEIVMSYRKLVKTHHPDKGGDNETIQEINAAYAVLIKS